MAHFARTKASVAWVAGYVLSHTDCDDIDTKTFKAINGDEGGTWSPSAQVILGGSGLRISGAPFQLYDAAPAVRVNFDPDTATAGANAFVNLTLPVSISGAGGMSMLSTQLDFQAGTLLLDAASTVTNHAANTTDGAWTINASTWTDHAAHTTDGNWTLNGGAWTATGGMTLTTGAGAGTWTFNNVLDFNGDITIEGAANTVKGPVDLQSTITPTGAGKIVKRVTTIAAPGAATINVSTLDLLYVPAGILAGATTYTLGATGAVDGAEVEVVSDDTVNQVTVAGVNSIILQNGTAGFPNTARFVYIGGGWRLKRHWY